MYFVFEICCSPIFSADKYHKSIDLSRIRKIAKTRAQRSSLLTRCRRALASSCHTYPTYLLYVSRALFSYIPVCVVAVYESAVRRQGQDRRGVSGGRARRTLRPVSHDMPAAARSSTEVVGSQNGSMPPIVGVR